MELCCYINMQNYVIVTTIDVNQWLLWKLSIQINTSDKSIIQCINT